MTLILSFSLFSWSHKDHLYGSWGPKSWLPIATNLQSQTPSGPMLLSSTICCWQRGYFLNLLFSGDCSDCTLVLCRKSQGLRLQQVLISVRHLWTQQSTARAPGFCVISDTRYRPWMKKKVPSAECSRWRHCDLWAVMNSWECYINIISDMLALLSLYSNINLRSRCKTSPNVFLCFCQGGGFGWTHYRCQCDAKITWLKNALVVFCSPLLFYI